MRTPVRRPSTSCPDGPVSAPARTRAGGRKGGLIIIPPARHGLVAAEDAVTLLTVAMSL